MHCHTFSVGSTHLKFQHLVIFLNVAPAMIEVIGHTILYRVLRIIRTAYSTVDGVIAHPLLTSRGIEILRELPLRYIGLIIFILQFIYRRCLDLHRPYQVNNSCAKMGGCCIKE